MIARKTRLLFIVISTILMAAAIFDAGDVSSVNVKEFNVELGFD
ncbi:hypothetical protein IFVP136_C1220253 [Vibrio parahaemolyticus]|nr:hypothetical protein VPBB_1425 [Vibrio parahaemolyticus BB22OP]